MALGPLFQCLETRLTNRFPVTRFMRSEQPVAKQQRDATLAYFDRRGHDNTPLDVCVSSVLGNEG
jgi:hypothetical protein